jgi:hypothetical protein
VCFFLLQQLKLVLAKGNKTKKPPFTDGLSYNTTHQEILISSDFDDLASSLIGKVRLGML